MKILWSSNAPWAATGYGQQTAEFVPRIRDAGHEIAVAAWYGLMGSDLQWDGIHVYPGGADPYGNDVVTAHATNFFEGGPEQGWIIALMDSHVINPATIKRYGANMAVWCPIDHDPAPPRVVNFFKESGAVPIAMSRHGARALEAEGLEPLYVPHGVDTKNYAPMDREEARKIVGLDAEAFVVGMVAANKGNPSRKAFPEALEAFKAFQSKHEDAVLYLHTEATGINMGVDLRVLIERLELPKDSVRFVSQYHHQVLGCSPGYMQAAYNAMDVLLAPSYAEGFGIPLIEAQACGTPVITQRFTAMAEVGQIGWQVGGQRVYTAQESWQSAPDIGQIIDALDSSYSGAARMRDRAREFAVSYDAESVMNLYWKPVLAELEARLPQEAEVVATARESMW